MTIRDSCGEAVVEWPTALHIRVRGAITQQLGLLQGHNHLGLRRLCVPLLVKCFARAHDVIDVIDDV